MDDFTFTSDAASMKRRNLLEQLMAIRSLMHKNGTAAADDDDSRDVIKDLAKKGITLNREQLTALSTEFLLTVLLDVMLLRLLDEGPIGSSDRQQVVDDAAAAKKKGKAAAKKKRYKRNKAAAKHKKTKLMSWLGGGIISVIMMVAFSFISTPIVTLSLFQPSDGLGEGKAPPALPPSASKSLRQEDIKSKNEASTSLDIIRSPLAAVVPPPVFAPIALSNRRRRMKSDEMRASKCLDTPNWKDKYDYGCDYYEEYDKEYDVCSFADELAGDIGSSTTNCCICGGGSHSLPPTNSPTITNSPTKSAAPSTAPSISNSPTKSANPSAAPSISNSPTKSANPSTSTAPSMCTDTEVWYDDEGYDCVWYEVMDDPGCPQYGDLYKEKNPPKGLANENCCYCKNAIVSTPSPTKSPSSSSTSAKSPSSPSPSVACVDTPGWKDKMGFECRLYEKDVDPGCLGTDYAAGDMGPASQHCCYCKNPSCEDFRSKCQERYINILGLEEDGMPRACEEAEACSCEVADHDVKIITDKWGDKQTFGLYNECKCDFWLRLCEDTRGGEACDYAAEYCCGDYENVDWGFEFISSPTCYCDFFNYVLDEFGHKLKPKSLNISKEFSNPCGRLQNTFAEAHSEFDFRLFFERPSLEAIYNETNGQNWANSDGWMNETVGHCEWYGITCDSDSFVTSIDLRNNNLAGRFPVYTRITFNGTIILENDWIYTKYGLANLFSLKTLDLANNKLTGTIDYRPLYNLHTLTHFDVSGNQLSGDVDALITPSLTYADFSNNLFTSMRRFEKLKQSFQSLRFCDVSNNTIQNKATDLLENIPPNIDQFFASNSEIYGSLPKSLNDLPKLRKFDMSSNALFGSLPGFTESFATLQELDVSGQKNGFNFTGSIPDNIWRSLSLKVLNLADNRLTGSIPTLVGNLAVLEVFDLTNNIVKGSIPSELGMLEGSLKHLRLSNNMFTGSIPSEIGRLQGASVFLKLKENNFYNSSKTAPLSLCTLLSVKEFDLENDTELCPVERNALSDFYDSTKGAEWTDSTNWQDEYESYCDWKGVTCDEDRQHVTELERANNGLSGRLNESIRHLTFIEKLDLSDNDIKTAACPLLLTRLPSAKIVQCAVSSFLMFVNSHHLSQYLSQTFIDTDTQHAGNSNDDCYPTEDTIVAKMDQTYGSFAAVCLAGFIVLCCMTVLLLYFVGKRKNRGNAQTMSEERRLEEDDKYALSRIGKESVYSYFVTEKPVGWLAAFATLAIQVAVLAFFVMASEANLQEDTIDIQFTWKCPRDSDVCKDKADLDKYGWIIFSLLMIAFLAKDMINGCKLIYHSSKVRHPLGSRIRYFIGGMCLCSITLFALYVSTVYNSAIATSNTAIIANSVIVLFIMEIDEYIFSAVDAINDKWTEHAADTKVSDMEKEIARQRAQIETQQEEIDNQRKDLRMLREAVEKIQESQTAAAAFDFGTAECEGNRSLDLVRFDGPNHFNMANTAYEQHHQLHPRTLRCHPRQRSKTKEEFKAGAATSSSTISQCTATAHESMTMNTAESEDNGPDAGSTNEMKDENALQTR
eukprot:scaffold6018_cov94-Skeletonema_dohrnii-CCMP3373.AAC.3